MWSHTLHDILEPIRYSSSMIVGWEILLSRPYFHTINTHLRRYMTSLMALCRSLDDYYRLFTSYGGAYRGYSIMCKAPDRAFCKDTLDGSYATNLAW